MNGLDLNRLYKKAARGTAALGIAASPAQVDELRFKLLSLVMGARDLLQEAGFQTQHTAADEWPEAIVHVEKDSRVYYFRFSAPASGAGNLDSLSFSGRISMASLQSGAVTEFSIYDDQGSIPLDRYEDLTRKIAEHIVVECGRLEYLRKQAEKPLKP